MNTFLTRGGGVFEWVLQTTWQAAVLAGLILLTLRLFRKRLSPAWRYGLWLLLVVRLVMPVSPPSTFSIFNLAPAETPVRVVQPAAAAPSGESASLSVAPAIVRGSDSPSREDSPRVREPALMADGGAGSLVPDQTAVGGSAKAAFPARVNWFQAALLLWLAGVSGFGLRLLWANLRFRSRLGKQAPLSDPAVSGLLNECEAVLGVRQQLTLIETGDVNTPAVYGLRHKRLLLPRGIRDRFTREELRYIFLHELAHLKRRDLEINWLIALLQVLHWFNPVVWFAFARMRADRELAADALALSRTRGDENTRYGETILKIVEAVNRPAAMPGLVGIAEDKAQIRQRVAAIARYGTARHWKWLAIILGGVIGLLTLTDAVVRAQPDAGGPATAKTDAAPPSAAKRFEITIVDYDTGAPVAGATVKFELTYRDQPSQSSERQTVSAKKEERATGADGKAAIEFAAANLSSFNYLAEKPGYITLDGTWSMSAIFQVPAEFQLKLSQGVEVGGTVTDPQGQPVAGAEIFFNRAISFGMGPSADPIGVRSREISTSERIAVTDASGTWRAKCIHPENPHRLALRVRHPDFADAVYSSEIPKAEDDYDLVFNDLLQRRAKFALSPGTVKGKVRDETGQPMPGIRVWYTDGNLRHTDRLPFVYWDRTATSDSKGEFIAHAPRKTVLFTVQADGYATMGKQWDLSSAPSEIELRLAREKMLQGQIIDGANGRPVRDARVSARNQDWIVPSAVNWTATTDAQGWFRWTNAPAQAFQLGIRKEGYRTIEKTIEGGGEQIIPIHRGLRVAGKVLDAATREPIQRFWIAKGTERDRPLEFFRWRIERNKGAYTMSLDISRYNLPELVIRVDADGYEPALWTCPSNQMDMGELTHDFELRPADKLDITVVDADGKPVPGVQLAFKTPMIGLRLAGKPRMSPNAVFPETDAGGHYLTFRTGEMTWVIAVHEKGIAWMETKNLPPRVTIQLQPWAKVQGTVYEYDRPATNQDVTLRSQLPSDWPPIDLYRHTVTSDDQGRFAFDFVPPHEGSLFRMIRGSSGPQESIDPAPGETKSVKLGGAGRPVVGRFTVKNPYVEINWPGAQIRATGVGDAAARNHPVFVSADGSFRINEVVPGQYDLRILVFDPRGATPYKSLISDSRKFEVPETPAGNREPHDLGEFELVLKADIQEGKTPAPAFTATDMDGNEFHLADFKGKYVLIDFWATWCGPCIADLPNLRSVWQRFGGRNDFVMISLSLDKTLAVPREFVKKNDMHWRQGYLGDWSKTDVPAKYGVVGIPAVFLVGPDGTIIAKEMRGLLLERRLAQLLK